MGSLLRASFITFHNLLCFCAFVPFYRQTICWLGHWSRHPVLSLVRHLKNGILNIMYIHLAGENSTWPVEVCCSNHVSTCNKPVYLYIKQLLLLLLLLPPLLPASMLKQLDDSMAVSIKKRAFPLIPAVFLSTSVVFVSFRLVLLLLCSEWSDSCHYGCH